MYVSATLWLKWLTNRSFIVFASCFPIAELCANFEKTTVPALVMRNGAKPALLVTLAMGLTISVVEKRAQKTPGHPWQSQMDCTQPNPSQKTINHSTVP